VVASAVAAAVDLGLAAVEAIMEASKCLFAALPLQEPAVDQLLSHLASTSPMCNRRRLMPLSRLSRIRCF